MQRGQLVLVGSPGVVQRAAPHGPVDVKRGDCSGARGRREGFELHVSEGMSGEGSHGFREATWEKRAKKGEKKRNGIISLERERRKKVECTLIEEAIDKKSELNTRKRLVRREGQQIGAGILRGILS